MKKSQKKPRASVYPVDEAQMARLANSFNRMAERRFPGLLPEMALSQVKPDVAARDNEPKN